MRATRGSRSNVPLRMGQQGDIDDDAGAVMAEGRALDRASVGSGLCNSEVRRITIPY